MPGGDERMDGLVEKALAHGFSHASTLDAGTLQPRAEVRDMCSADKCGHYDQIGADSYSPDAASAAEAAEAFVG
jgi:hypothetical protein